MSSLEGRVEKDSIFSFLASSWKKKKAGETPAVMLHGMLSRKLCQGSLNISNTQRNRKGRIVGIR